MNKHHMEPKAISLTVYVGRRILAAIPLMAGVLVLTVWSFIHVAPGDPVAILAGEYTTPEHQAFIQANSSASTAHPCSGCGFTSRALSRWISGSPMPPAGQ